MNGRAAAAAACLSLLIGCSADPKPPSTLPPLSASATPSATPVPTPSGLHAPDAFGASAFTKYWFQVLDRGFAQRDATQLRALSEADCATCSNFAEAIESLATMDERLVGGGFLVRYAEAPPPEDAAVVVNVSFDRAAATRMSSAGEQLSRAASEDDVRAEALVRYVSGRWRMSALRLSR